MAFIIGSRCGSEAPHHPKSIEGRSGPPALIWSTMLFALEPSQVDIMSFVEYFTYFSIEYQLETEC